MLALLQFIITRFMPVWILCFAFLAYQFPAVFLPLRPLAAPALAFILFFMGLTLSRDSIRRVIRKPQNAIIGIAMKWTMTLGVSIALAYFFFKDIPELYAGVVLAGSVPGGTSANLYTYMIGGNVALSITMAGLDTVIGPFLTPVIMKQVVGSIMEVEFWPIFLRMVYIVLLPIALGLLIQWKWEDKILRVKPIIPVLSAVSLFLVDVAVVSQAQSMLEEYISLLPLLFLCVTLQVLLPMIGSYVLAGALKMEEGDRRAILYECGICNTALAAILASEYLSPVAAIPAVANMIMNLSIGALIAVTGDPLWQRWQAAKNKRRHPKAG